jgi:hypothetical protein
MTAVSSMATDSRSDRVDRCGASMDEALLNAS